MSIVIFRRILLLPLILLIGVGSIEAQIPRTMSFQALLAGSDATPVPDGTHSLVVSLYDAGEGGSALWREEHGSVVVERGLLSIILGASTPLSLPFDAPYWLGVALDGEAEFSPRIALTAAPYSLNSLTQLAEPPAGASFVVRNEEGTAVHELTPDGLARHAGTLLLGEVPESDSDSPIPPGGTDPEDLRLLVWSQADNLVRFASSGDAQLADSDWVESVLANEVFTMRSIVLRIGGSDVFFAEANPTAGAPRLYTENDSGIALWAISRGSDPAVQGHAEGSGDAVVGLATGDGNGVEGESQGDGIGVSGRAGGAAAAVRGEHTGAGPGIQGEASAGPAGRFLGDVEIQQGGGSEGFLVLKTIEASSQPNPTRFLLRDSDGKVREADVPVGGGAGGDADWVDSGTTVHTVNKSIHLLDPAGATKFTVASGLNPPVRLEAQSSLDGVLGKSTGTGRGVRGESAQGDGVLGTSDAPMGNGVRGQSEHVGVRGESSMDWGVYGLSEARLPRLGETGTDATGAGVRGEATDATGVEGISVHRIGVKGQSDEYYGAYGKSSGNHGVYGETEDRDVADLTAGVFGEGNQFGIGVRGHSDEVDGVYGGSEESNGVYGTTGGELTATSDFAGVKGEAANSYGVRGRSENRSGIHGTTLSDNVQRDAGVWGKAADTHGLRGDSDNYNGVHGISNAASSMQAGVRGIATEGANGVHGTAEGAIGVFGEAGVGIGVRGTAEETGRAGQFDGQVHIVDGPTASKLRIESMETDAEAPCLVWSEDQFVRSRDCWTLIEDDSGESPVTYLQSKYGIRVVGGEGGEETVFEVMSDGTSTHKGLETFEKGLKIPLGGDRFARIMPDSGFSIYDEETGKYYFHADPDGNGLFDGFVGMEGLSVNVLITPDKNFVIDHPLDPANKFLYHTSVESDQRMNMYSGTTLTAADGFATVALPSWFETLNRDFTYQLTAIGSFARIMVAEEIENGRFTIRSEEPNVRVSWLVTGVRQDAWARAYPAPVEVPKLENERGRYLSPEAFGLPESLLLRNPTHARSRLSTEKPGTALPRRGGK